MPTFVLMTRLAPQSVHDAEGRRAMGKEWLKKVHAACPDVSTRVMPKSISCWTPSCISAMTSKAR